MNNEKIDETSTSDEKVVELVAKAKHRPLPRSTKVLFTIVIFAMVFTGGIAYGKHKATASTGAGLSLSALGGAGGFGAGGFGAGGFGGGRNRNGGAGAGAGTAAGGGSALTLNSGAGAGTGAVATTPADVAGTVVSITAKSVVISTLSGGNETFPITDTTKVRSSTKVDLTTVKAGDIVTIKPDESANAKTIMVVK
jgi:hypothetical protein